MNRLLNDIPSIPKIPSVAPLHLGITTRVMAKRLALQREKSAMENVKAVDVEQSSRRRSSKFLEGAAIPNSIIRADLQVPDPLPKDKAAIKKDRDEFVEKLLKRLQPQKKMFHSIYDEDVDREALNRIKKELQRRSLLPLTHNNEQDKQSLSLGTVSRSTSIKDPWEELKEKRRISRRTSILAPLNGEKRPTYESIKKAIQNSKIIQQLLDTDKIEEQKMKQLQMKKSSEINENASDKLTEEQGSPTGLKKVKKESAKTGKERKGSRRKSSLNLKKPTNVTIADKSVVKQKTGNDSRRLSKRSDTSRTLKEELQQQSSLIIHNILQQRKNSRSIKT